MIPLKHGGASTDIHLCRSSCELSYLRRSAELLPTVRGGSTAFSQWLSQIALLNLWDDFDMLNNPVQWVQEVAFEVRLRSRSPCLLVGITCRSLEFLRPAAVSFT